MAPPPWDARWRTSSPAATCATSSCSCNGSAGRGRAASSRSCTCEGATAASRSSPPPRRCEARTALRLITRYPESVPLLEVDPDHIKRAVTNLVDNAVEAVSGAGNVEVEIANVPDGGVQLIVSDDGPGIRPEDKEKLFLPYF